MGQTDSNQLDDTMFNDLLDDVVHKVGDMMYEKIDEGKDDEVKDIPNFIGIAARKIGGTDRAWADSELDIPRENYDAALESIGVQMVDSDLEPVAAWMAITASMEVEVDGNKITRNGKLIVGMASDLRTNGAFLYVDADRDVSGKIFRTSDKEDHGLVDTDMLYPLFRAAKHRHSANEGKPLDSTKIDDLARGLFKGLRG